MAAGSGGGSSADRHPIVATDFLPDPCRAVRRRAPGVNATGPPGVSLPNSTLVVALAGTACRAGLGTPAAPDAGPDGSRGRMAVEPELRAVEAEGLRPP